MNKGTECLRKKNVLEGFLFGIFSSHYPTAVVFHSFIWKRNRSIKTTRTNASNEVKSQSQSRIYISFIYMGGSQKRYPFFLVSHLQPWQNLTLLFGFNPWKFIYIEIKTIFIMVSEWASSSVTILFRIFFLFTVVGHFCTFVSFWCLSATLAVHDCFSQMCVPQNAQY